MKPYIGSFDAGKQMLTVVQYSFFGDSTYMNSLRSLQDFPYAGDVVNSFNDGPLEALNEISKQHWEKI